MKITGWIYDATTGDLLYRFNGSDSQLDANKPEGCGFIKGEYDGLSQRVDPSTGQVVDYQPPAPDDDHEWIHDDEDGNRVRRWVLKAEVAERRAIKAAALQRIAELERKQERAMREHVLGIELTEEDIAAGAMTLQQIEDAIAEQRAIIHEADSSPTESNDE